MPKEFKFIALQSEDSKGVHFKADSGPGELTGYAAVFGVIDEGGDIILSGAFKDTIDEYLSAGFTAHSHDWSVDGVIGYPTKAFEDDYGFFVESKFHSTADAQAVRTKAQERMNAGKQVGLSIGYQPVGTPQYVYPKDYDKELPNYLRADSLDDELKKAKRFAKIRLLSKLDNFEHSIVTAPMNKLAQAVSVKASEPVNVKGMFEDRLTEKTNSFHNLCETLSFVIYRIRYMASQAEEAGTTFEAEGMLDEALSEFSSRLKGAVLESLQSNESYADYYYMGNLEHFSKSLSGKNGVATIPTLAERSNLAASACEEFAQRSAGFIPALNVWIEDCKSKLDARTKEGRTISQANANKISTAKDQIDEAIPSLETCSAALADMLEMAMPKERVSPDIARALRTQTLRLQSRAVGVPI